MDTILTVDVSEGLEFDPSKKKRRVKKSAPAAEEEKITASVQEDGEADYTYGELLSRVYDAMSSEKGESDMGRHKKSIEPPSVSKVGTKKVAWTNFSSTCRSLRRETTQVMMFVLTEFAATGSLDGSGNLIIKGRYTSKQLESVLTKYIKDYVSCATCHFLNTELIRENRVLFKSCKDCGASSSVSSIRRGFSVQGRRKKE